MGECIKIETDKVNGHGSSCIEHKLESSDTFFKNLKMEWRRMWRERFDDKLRAEGIAREDYPLLFLVRGTVVIATRKYKAPDFSEILECHHELSATERIVHVNPWTGGWRKFIKSVFSKQQRYSERKRPEPSRSERKNKLQRKKSGRGWVHRF